MTWVAITEDSVLDGTEADEPGAVMFRLMCSQPSAVARDFIDWVDMRDARAEKAVRALFYHIEAAALKEEYLQCVSTCAKEVGFYNILYSDFSIRTDETEGDE